MTDQDGKELGSVLIGMAQEILCVVRTDASSRCVLKSTRSKLWIGDTSCCSISATLVNEQESLTLCCQGEMRKMLSICDWWQWADFPHQPSFNMPSVRWASLGESIIINVTKVVVAAPLIASSDIGTLLSGAYNACNQRLNKTRARSPSYDW